MVRKKGRTNKWKKFDERLSSIRNFFEQAATIPGTVEYKRTERRKHFFDGINKKWDGAVRRRWNVLQDSQELEPIRKTVGNEIWNRLALIFLGLPVHYNTLGERERDARKRQTRVVKKCRELSQLLETHDPEQWYAFSPRPASSTPTRPIDPEQWYDNVFSPSPLEGALARFILNSDWVLALDCLRERYPPKTADKKLEHLFSGIRHLDTSYFLSHFLRYYADTIEHEPFSQYYQLLFQHTGGKLSLKEFTKRVVFTSLKQHWPARRNPNKETALIVNAILGLQGEAIVTANDITQMNKPKRRQYHKEKRR